MKSEKILSFSPYAYWRLHALYEIAICHNLKWRGHDYTYVSCDGLFTDCDMFWESTVGPRPANACVACQSQVKSLLEGCRIPHTWLGKYRTPDGERLAQSFAQNLKDSELLGAVFGQYPVGAWVKSSVHTHLRVNAIDLTNPRHCATLRSYLFSGAFAATCIARMLDAEQPTIMLLFNGRMAVTHIAFQLARERGIRVVCHERGMIKETLQLWENETCLSLQPYAKFGREWAGMPLSAREVPKVTRWLLDRAHGTNLNWKTFSTQNTLGSLQPFLARHQGRQLWSLCSSSMDEIASDENFFSVFETQNRWIHETIDFVRRHPAIALVIRVHPNSGSKKSTGTNQDELRFFGSLKNALPDNVALVMPEDEVSTYALIDRTDLGLVYCSTVALEMACRGIKVLLGGHSPWVFCEAMEYLPDAGGYAAVLEKYAANPRTRAETERIAAAAYRFAYAYVYRWNIPFPLVHMPDVHNGELKARTLDELKPGVHDCLDYCTEIVLGTRPSIPVVTAPARPGAAAEEAAALRLALKALAGEPPAPAPLRVSVVITCYNYGKFLRACVRSVAQQTFAGLELIIVNDGSTDDSLAVAQACIKDFTTLAITLVDQPNSGQPALARNAGIRRAKGEFVLPIDADDQIDPAYLEEAFKVIDADPKVDLVYCDSLFDNGKARSRKTPGRFDAKALAAANQLVYCCVYRRSIWEKVGGYRDNVRGYEDWDFWLAASLTGATAVYVRCLGLLYNEKDSGVYSETVAHHQARYAQVMLNNPKAYPTAQLQQARTLLATLRAPKAPALVSVVIPCYQQAQYLAEAVQSVCAQSYPHWEIIIVNDGSPDNTSEVAQTLIYQHAGRAIRLIEKPNGGLADARNAGIRFAQGEYILPLDADDLIDPTFLAKTVALLERNPGVGIAYTDWIYFGAHQTARNAIDYDFKRLCTKENLFTCTSLYRKKAWDAAGGYNPNMTRGVEDWDFWIGCGEHGFKGQRIAEPLFFYRAKDASMIHTLQPHLPAMFARIILNHPKLYNPEAVRKAGEIFAAARLAPPKPSSPGTEWVPPALTTADFAQSVTEAEALVRDGQLEAAIAKIEQTLRLAPTAECSARAKEILDLLRAARPASAGATVAGTSAAAVSDEIFGADELKNVQQLIATYGANPADPAREQLLELQQGLMNFLVTNDAASLEVHFKGSFGVVFRALVKSGLSSELPTAEAQAQLAILDEALAGLGNSKTDFDYRPLLARMLCAPAHRGTTTPAPDQIPAWAFEDYLDYVFHAPQVFVIAGEAERYHAHLLAWARVIQQRTRNAPGAPLTRRLATGFAGKANCIPLYLSQGNTREFMQLRAAILEFILRQNGAAIDAMLPKRPKDRRRIKVGFLSAHFGAQTETHVTLPSLQLDRERFEICLFPVASNPGPIEEYCRSFADSFTPLPKELPRQVKAIRDAALDVVIIGTNITAVTNQVALIALHRLAPVQLANYCSPASTGMRHLDGFLTGSRLNTPGLQEHFSEKLWFTDGPPGCLDYTVERPASAVRFTRASLGLAADDVVFINAASCFKILPEMQEIWAKILSAVPNSRLLLLPFNPNWSNAFPVKQFERTLTDACARHGVARDRFIMADALPSRADVKALERLADVYLDTVTFSGSISVIDPLELGLPTVVGEGQTARSRAAAALLREIEIPELIAADEPGYVSLAVKLGTDAAYRRQLKGRILAAMALKPSFINPTAYAQGLGELIASRVAGKKLAVPAPALVVA